MSGTLLASRAILVIALMVGVEIAVGTVTAGDVELTPMGSVAAGNVDGSIPAWSPITTKGTPRAVNPYAQEQPVLTVTAANAAQYSALLAPSQKVRLERYPGYRMPVYPSHRGATFPDWFLDATRDNEQRVKLTADGQGFAGTAMGYPFRRPRSGVEALWNHVVRYNTSGFRGYLSTAVSLPGAGFDLERRYLEFAFWYNRRDAQPESVKPRNLSFLSKIIDPPVKAGTGDLVRLPLNRFATAVEAWIFLPQSGRVYRGPDNGYDTPFNDGLMTFDQVDMFNGPTDRYQLELVGQREMLVPYNTYALYSDKLKYGQIMGDGHLRPEVLRYEKHRVWVIDARLKSGMKHLYGRRTLYLDEDTWAVLVQDLYDAQGQLIRGAEAYPVPYPDQSVTLLGVQLFDDFKLGRFALMNLTNEEDEFPEFGWHPPSNNYFMPSNLTRFTQTKHKTRS
ncbi:MAG: DUF1329 domain-containing protein [Panacagrimonas sp.]